MRLPEAEVELFYELYHPLLVYANQRLEVVEGIDSPGDIPGLPLEEIHEIRKRLYEHPELMEAFVEENPNGFSTEELSIVASWQHFMEGTFYVFRYLKKHTIFLGTEKPAKAYGVLALYSPFEEILGPALPIMVDAVLLPFKGKIVYDGILIPYPIAFGRGGPGRVQRCVRGGQSEVWGDHLAPPLRRGDGEGTG